MKNSLKLTILILFSPSFALAAEESQKFSPVFTLLGKLHPLLVHFPIALIIFALIFELMDLIKGRGDTPRRSLSLLLYGSFFAVLAASLGWIDAILEEDELGKNLADLVFYHRWLGVGVAGLSLVTLMIGINAQQQKKGLGLYRLLLTICALMVGFGAHFGALLVYGPDYFELGADNDEQVQTDKAVPPSNP